MKKAFWEYFLIIVGAFLLGVGINLFLVPFKLSSGGVGGVGVVLFYLFKIPLWATNLTLNAALFGLGFKFLGRSSIIKTTIGTLLLSLFLLISQLFPLPKCDTISALFLGGSLVGCGVGLILRAGGSSGGSDLLALILKPIFPHIPLATIILVIDVIIIGISGIAFSDLGITVYSIICMYLSSKISDAIINYGASAKSLYITSEKSEEIKEVILKDFERGVTEIYTQGGYFGEKRYMLYCVLSPKEAPRLTKRIKEIDPFAFIVINDAKEVLGNGFLPLD